MCSWTSCLIFSKAPSGSSKGNRSKILWISPPGMDSPAERPLPLSPLAIRDGISQTIGADAEKLNHWELEYPFYDNK